MFLKIKRMNTNQKMIQRKKRESKLIKKEAKSSKTLKPRVNKIKKINRKINNKIKSNRNESNDITINILLDIIYKYMFLLKLIKTETILNCIYQKYYFLVLKIIERVKQRLEGYMDKINLLIILGEKIITIYSLILN